MVQELLCSPEYHGDEKTKDDSSSAYSGGEENGDLVSWIPFLRQLSIFQSASQPDEIVLIDHDLSEIGIISRERTWDLVPPDVIRPMATIKLGTLITIAHRLRMRWRDHRISEGTFRAEGEGHTLVSTTVRGLGMVFRYNFTTVIHSHKQRLERIRLLLKIPNEPADKMACGILPGCRDFLIPDIPLIGRDNQETRSMLRAGLIELRVPERLADEMSSTELFEKFCAPTRVPVMFPMHELVALVCPFLSSSAYLNYKVSWPFRAHCQPSVFAFWECKEVLWTRLKQLHSESNCHHLGEVLDKLTRIDFRPRLPHQPLSRWPLLLNEDKVSPELKADLVKLLKATHEWTTEYLQNPSNRFYIDLVAAHTAMALKSARVALETSRKKLTRNKDGNVGTQEGDERGPRWFRELAHMYVDLLPELVKDMQRRGHDMTPEYIRRAWWTLMLRGICWRMSLFAVDHDYSIPSELYYSQLPVYLS